MKMTAFILTLTLLAAGPAHAETTSTAAVTSFFPDTSIALPLDQGMKLDWALQPLEDGATAQAKAETFVFDVDPQGSPWFGAGAKRFLANPLKNIALMTDVPFNNFVWLDGDRVLCTDTAFGGLASTGKAERVENGLPVLKFVPVVREDYPGCRVFAGAKGALYVVSYDRSTKDYEILLFKHVKGKLKAENLMALKVMPIAVTGDGDSTFFAVGRGVWLVTSAHPKQQLYIRSKENYTGLAYSPEAGLFYTTPSLVGYASPDLQLKFMHSPNPEIVLRDGTLYVRLNRTFGVVKIEGANRFRNLRSASN